MELTPLGIEGVWLAESPVWSDDRGGFREWFKGEDVRSITGIDFSIQQANVSLSKKGVIRGIHFSLAPKGQAKWVSCVSGAILDVIVDVRPTSQTFGQYVSVDLNSQQGKSIFIERGLGHGFIALEDNSTVAYFQSSEFNPKYELGINPFDPDIEIDWQIGRIGDSKVILSEKDSAAPNLRDLVALKKLK
jgi:dTDP-4-dehydrorhamnose 3,5-epimerase